MSQWTHLCGLVRVDMSFRLTLEQIADMFRQDIPTGTEGSGYVVVTPENDETYGDAIYIVGDLRSVGRNNSEIESIVYWFRNTLDKLEVDYNVLVRSAILQIDVESKPTHIVSFTGGFDNPEHVIIPLKIQSLESTMKEDKS